MKEGTYVVKLFFSESISREDGARIAENILNTLVNTVHYAQALVPDDAPAFTAMITVENVETAAFIGRDLCSGELI